MSLLSIKFEAIFALMKSISYLISLVLSTLIILSSVRVTLTYVYYELDPVGFIENLCENKDKPELECNGKCQLKKVAEHETENPKEPLKYISLKEITFFVVEKSKLILYTFPQAKKIYSDHKNLYAYKGIYLIDHPPKA